MCTLNITPFFPLRIFKFECTDHYINAMDSSNERMKTLLSVSIAEHDYSLNKKQKNRKGSSKLEQEEAAFELQVQLNNYPGDVDPNEPLYCFCRRVSFGRMIGCENETCKYEWFHFDCVGVQDPEPEQWWCDDCKPGESDAEATGPKGGPESYAEQSGIDDAGKEVLQADANEDGGNDGSVDQLPS